MHACPEFARKRLVYHAVPFEPGLSAKGSRHNMNPEVGFPTRSMSGMASVQVGFIHDVEAHRFKRHGKLLGDQIAGAHGYRLIGRHASRSMPLPMASPSARNRSFTFVKT